MRRFRLVMCRSALLAAGAVALMPLAARACSLMPWYERPSPDFGDFLLGRALPDTLSAGPGGMEFTLAPGHFGRPVARDIYGQVVVVDRLSPRASAELREAVAAAGGRAVLVPWDYGADCHPVPWARSARWIDVTERGVFQGVLRAREHWVSGMPTFDVRAPQFSPYPASVPRTMTQAYVGAMLTADELLELTGMAPSRREIVGRLDSALVPLERWAAAHPELARRFPAAELLRSARWEVEDAVFRRREVSWAGTWRFVLDFGGGDTSAVVVRTERHPTSALRARGVGDLRTMRRDAPAIGYSVLACIAASPAALEDGCRGGSTAGLGHVVFADSAIVGANGERTVAGSVDVLRALRRHPLDVMQRQHLPGLVPVLDSLLRADVIGFLPGTFTLHPDGRRTFALRIERDGAVLFRVRGERISEHVLSRD